MKGVATFFVLSVFLIPNISMAGGGGDSIPFPDQGSICGDGKLQITEDCDHGPANGATGDTCSSACVYVPALKVDPDCWTKKYQTAKSLYCAKTYYNNILCKSDLEFFLDLSAEACEVDEKPQVMVAAIGDVKTETSQEAADSGVSGGGCSMQGAVGTGMEGALWYLWLGMAGLAVLRFRRK